MVMVSARRGESHGRRRRYRHLPQLIFGLIGVCLLGCIFLLLQQASNLVPPEQKELLLSPPAKGNGRAGLKGDAKIKPDKQYEGKVKETDGRGEGKVAVNDRVVASVVCGGHSSPSCAQCPQGHGKDWCNGDCSWCEDKQECMDKSTFCPGCLSRAADEASCNKLKPECSWCDVTNQCLHVDSFCPKERTWKAPEPEPWFNPPNPIDKYGKTISVVLPCGSENEFFERTIRSVHAATPPEVLKEIVVVDDNSDPPLEPTFTLDPSDFKVNFVRSNVSLGLIDAKHQGAEAASGDIIVFFDCHVKPALGYWEPFVREIADNPKRVVVPSITSLDVDTWVEFNRPHDRQGGMSKCYVTFDSDFKWTSDDKPWVPIMSGGLLAIGRDWFFKIGGHDQQMKVSKQSRNVSFLSRHIM